MINHDVIACGNDPHSSTAPTELVGRLTRKFEQELSKVVTTVCPEELTRQLFRSMLTDLGRDAVTQLLNDQDEARASIEVDVCRMRFRDASERDWLTSFGSKRREPPRRRD